MHRALAYLLALSIANPLVMESVAASKAAVASISQPQDYSSDVYFSSDQLENLLAPIALYPDPLLAQVLLAATFVDEIDDANRYVRAYGTSGVDDQDWDVSVKAVAHYPTVLSMLDDKIDWTTSLGQAYVNQSTDVMAAVQRLREMAHSAGNLVSTPEQEVIDDGGYYEIVPAQPQYIYVPVYDPGVIYYQRAYFGGWRGNVFSFSAGFAIGAWLNHDFDWRERRVYYTGWRGRPWIERSRPYVRETNVYVNNRYTNITVNRTVVNRQVNYTNINRYNSVHRDVNYGNVRGNQNRPPDNRGNFQRNTNQGNQAPPADANRPATNKIIDRNIDTRDPRLEKYRGRQAGGQQPPPQQQQQQQNQQQIDRGRQDRGQQQQQQQQQQQNQQQQAVQQAQQRAQQQQQNQQRQQEQNQQQQAQQQAQQRAQQQTQRQAPAQQHGFGRSEGNFDPQAASRRGEASRTQAARPPTPPPPPPRAAGPPPRNAAPPPAPNRHPGKRP